MKVGILGTGDVGKALGNGCLALGYEVKMGAREAGSPKAREWAEKAGAKASTGTFAEAAEFGEMLFLCTLGSATPSVIEHAGPSRLKGKVLIDATNPLDFSAGFPPSLITPKDGSGGAEVQALAPEALVVKAFNTVGNADMFKPAFPGGPPDMFICGNDDGAKERVGKLLRDFGWGVIDIGSIKTAHYLEAMCLVWVLHSARTGRWNHAFKMLEK